LLPYLGSIAALKMSQPKKSCTRIKESIKMRLSIDLQILNSNNKEVENATANVHKSIKISFKELFMYCFV
jgi:hypothetical protein